MGALHAGHRRLVREAVGSGAATIASIFVNPLQFAASEDLSRYPRDELGDLAALQAEGCTLTWLPDSATMYPADAATTVTVAGPAERWEGDTRPGHFRGVATVCAKLFGQVHPDQAFFGEKDWQQLQVIKRMVADLLLPLEIIGVETVREPDGLAMSSRNRFLTEDQRMIAPILFSVLTESSGRMRAGANVTDTLAESRHRLINHGFEPDYLALVEGVSLQPLTSLTPGARLIAAARLGSVRLLDNIGLA